MVLIVLAMAFISGLLLSFKKQKQKQKQVLIWHPIPHPTPQGT
jgi:hypothetical protein